MFNKDSPQDLTELAAEIMSQKFLESIRSDVSDGWAEIAYEIAKDPNGAARFFDVRTIKLAKIYISSLNLFAEMDENSGLISGEEEAEAEAEVETPVDNPFDFDEDE